MRLLLADDDHDTVQTLADLLTVLLAPTDIAIAHDGQEALEKARLVKPDVVIMDIEMPRMNGVDAALAMRPALGPGQAKFIAVTGHATLAKVVQSHGAFDHVLLKPLDIDVLVRLLDA